MRMWKRYYSAIIKYVYTKVLSLVHWLAPNLAFDMSLNGEACSVCLELRNNCCIKYVKFYLNGVHSWPKHHCCWKKSLGTIVELLHWWPLINIDGKQEKMITLKCYCDEFSFQCIQSHLSVLRAVIKGSWDLNHYGVFGTHYSDNCSFYVRVLI